MSAAERPLRVLYVTRQLPPLARGGIGTYVLTLAGMMRDAGNEVTILCAAPGQVRATERIDGITIERFGGFGPAWLWDRLLAGGRWSVSRFHAALSAWAALRALRGSFDVIEAPEWKAEGLLLPRRRRGALVVHLHLSLEVVRRWDGPGGQPRSRVGELLERLTVRRATAVTATSRLSSTLPAGRSWPDGIGVATVPPPLEPRDWSTATRLDRTGPVVLFVGHLERRKAPEVLLSALGLLAGEIDGLRGVFVGRSLPYAEGVRYDQHLRSEASRLGVDVELRPATAGPEEMRQLYGDARVVVVCSRYETLSMVALEAFAAGRPAVMTSAVGAAEWLGDAVPELVVPPGDPSALACALRRLIVDEAEAQRLATLGRDRVMAVCSPATVVGERLAVYRAAAGLADRALEPVPC